MLFLTCYAHCLFLIFFLLFDICPLSRFSIAIYSNAVFYLPYAHCFCFLFPLYTAMLFFTCHMSTASFFLYLHMPIASICYSHIYCHAVSYLPYVICPFFIWQMLIAFDFSIAIYTDVLFSICQVPIPSVYYYHIYCHAISYCHKPTAML